MQRAVGRVPVEHSQAATARIREQLPHAWSGGSSRSPSSCVGMLREPADRRLHVLGARAAQRFRRSTAGARPCTCTRSASCRPLLLGRPILRELLRANCRSLGADSEPRSLGIAAPSPATPDGRPAAPPTASSRHRPRVACAVSTGPDRSRSTGPSSPPPLGNFRPLGSTDTG